MMLAIQPKHQAGPPSLHPGNVTMVKALDEILLYSCMAAVVMAIIVLAAASWIS